MFNDLGVYGVPQAVKDKKRFDAVDAMRDMEKYTQRVGGYPFLYADVFMTREEFEKMFDLTRKAFQRMTYKFLKLKLCFLQIMKWLERSTMPLVPSHTCMTRSSQRLMSSKSANNT